MADLSIDTHESTRESTSRSIRSFLRSRYVIEASEGDTSVSLTVRGGLETISGTNTFTGVSVYRKCSIDGGANCASPDSVSINGVTYYGDKTVASYTVSREIERTHDWQVVTISARQHVMGKVERNGTAESYLDYDSGSSSKNIEMEVLVAPRDSYLISFDANGGDQAQCPEPLTKWRDEELTFPEGAMESGRGVFVGWALDPDGAVAFPSGAIPASFNRDATFYAVWDDGVYVLRLDPNGATGEAVEIGCEVGISCALGPCPFSREGYDFLGWAQSADGSARYADNGTFTMLQEDYSTKCTLYACWRRGKPSITALETDRTGETSAVAKVCFTLYHAADYETRDERPTATARVTCDPRGAGDQVVVTARNVPEPEEGQAVVVDVAGLDEARAYDMKVEMVDGLDPSLSAEAYSMIGTGSYTLDFAPGGKGIGVFRKCPDGHDGLFVDGVLDYNGKTLERLLEEVRKAAALDAHPVGSYYWSDEPDDPGTIFGGTWKAVTDRFVYAAGEKGVGDTGGAKEVRLTAAQSGSPAHKHSVGAVNTGNASVDHTHSMQGHTHTTSQELLGSPDGTSFLRLAGRLKTASATGYTASHSFVYKDTEGATGKKATGGPSVASTGGQSATHAHQVPAHETADSAGADASQAHDNMPPYIVAYCWRRTA